MGMFGFGGRDEGPYSNRGGGCYVSGDGPSGPSYSHDGQPLNLAARVDKRMRDKTDAKLDRIIELLEQLLEARP